MIDFFKVSSPPYFSLDGKIGKRSRLQIILLKLYYAPLRRINSLSLKQNSSLKAPLHKFSLRILFDAVKYEPNKDI